MKTKAAQFRKKNNLILLLASSLAFITILIALMIYPLHSRADEEHEGWKIKHAEMIEEKMHQLHDRLKLNPQQEKSWLIFSEQVKNKDHHHGWDRKNIDTLSTPERLDLMLSQMKKRQEIMETHIKAVKTFYNQLTIEQKKSFDESYREFEHKWHHEKEGKERSEKHHD